MIYLDIAIISTYITLFLLSSFALRYPIIRIVSYIFIFLYFSLDFIFYYGIIVV